MKPAVRIAAFIGNMAPDFLPIVFTIALRGKKRQNKTIPANAGSRKHAALTFRPNASTGRKKTSAGFQNCSMSRNKIRSRLFRQIYRRRTAPRFYRKNCACRRRLPCGNRAQTCGLFSCGLFAPDGADRYSVKDCGLRPAPARGNAS